ncbi:hypothetical protein WKW50_25920, partial [Ochrobactrum sp. GPK 3]
MGSGGEGGNVFGANGKNATGTALTAGGGGGGAVGALEILPSVSIIKGGDGGNGVAGTSDGNLKATNGGGGGAGLFLGSGVASTHVGMAISGGKGGAGSYSGGGGGAGAMINGQLINVQGATIFGGAGGAGPSQGTLGGGGDGVAVVGVGSRFENFGTVKGGGSDAAANAGSGIRLGHDAYVVNAGIVQPGSTSASAIEIVGERATLELRAGSYIQGAVIVSSGITDAALFFGGTADMSINATTDIYSGFATVGKTGAGTLTLTGT